MCINHIFCFPYGCSLNNSTLGRNEVIWGLFLYLKPSWQVKIKYTLTKWHSVQGKKIYCVVPSSLKSAQLPPRQAHSRGPLWMYIQMGLVSHAVTAEMSPDGLALVWGAVDGVSSGLYGSGQAWLDHFHTEGPWSSLSITLRLSGYSWLRTFTLVLLFLPSAKLVVQRVAFTETVILMASLGG